MLLENSALSHGRVSEKVSENIRMFLRGELIQAANNLMSDILCPTTLRKKNTLIARQIIAIIPSSSCNNLILDIRFLFDSIRKLLYIMILLLP